MVILLVGDDVSAKFSIWKVLKANGFTVLTAQNGETALQVSRKHPGSIDLMFTDMDTPRMNSLELSTNIKAERPEIKLLVMSANPHAKEQLSISGIPFLQKPFTTTVLRDSIEALLGPVPSSIAGC